MSLARALKYAVNAGSKQNVFSASKVFSRFSSITTWNKDWKPGPYPKTEEERIAAAKKYHMLPEDYEPYPEEEGYGDYPKFQAIHMENLSDHNLYDFPVLKRNFCEPLHPDFDMCQEDRVNFQKDYRTPIWKMYLYVITAVVVYSSVMVYCEKYHPFMEEKLTSKIIYIEQETFMSHNLRTAVTMNILYEDIPKQYPYRGSKSYTFEPAE